MKVKNGNPEYFFWTGLTTPEDAPSYFHKLYRRVFNAAGVKGSSHHFRHTYAIELLKLAAFVRLVTAVVTILRMAPIVPPPKTACDLHHALGQIF